MDAPATVAQLSWLRLAFIALALVIVFAYQALLLRRLNLRQGLLLSLTLALILGAVGWLVWPSSAAFAIPLAALAFGHAGFEFGRRSIGSSSPALLTEQLAQASMEASGASMNGPDRSMLGRYCIERELGRGAMGAVYLGRDPKIGRQVAIKTMALSREFAGDALAEARRRFFREAETAGRLQHPDIVTIFDAGEDQDLAFIAMEYLRGDDLQAFTQAPRLLSVPVVLNVVARVADALAYAHSQGVVHRDIKPANVMVDLPTDAVKVTDFGIAHVADSSRTRTGMVLGTPSFMSPEQMSGRRVDGRSDLYSLGVMLFQLLTGKLPHRSDSMATLMQQIANEPAPDVRTYRPELPASLASIVALALEKRPELRYPGGQQLASDLREVAASWIEVSGSPPHATAVQNPPDSSEFEATVKLERLDAGHNSDF